MAQQRQAWTSKDVLPNGCLKIHFFFLQPHFKGKNVGIVGMWSLGLVSMFNIKLCAF